MNHISAKGKKMISDIVFVASLVKGIELSHKDRINKQGGLLDWFVEYLKKESQV